MIDESTGRIYIDVPDVTRYKNLDSLHVAHVYHFGPITLRRAAALGGYGADVLERHQPVMHPESIRCLLHAQPGIQADMHLTHEGWDELRNAQRRAARYHRKRWSIGRRLRHFMQHLGGQGPRQEAA